MATVKHLLDLIICTSTPSRTARLPITVYTTLDNITRALFTRIKIRNTQTNKRGKRAGIEVSQLKEECWLASCFGFTARVGDKELRSTWEVILS